MTDVLELSTDVLVNGGGPAGAWAALRAAKAGADVVLVDKGYCGTSGATAPSGTGVWYVEPDTTARERAKAGREALGGYLADHHWMDRVLEQTYSNMDLLAVEGRYPFPIDPSTGKQIRTGLQGPEYMRRMRTWIRRAGVRILDHSPALELLVDDAGRVRGAAGYQRHEQQDYRVSAGAVVVASGGCAFLSGSPTRTESQRPDRRSPRRLTTRTRRSFTQTEACSKGPVRRRGGPSSPARCGTSRSSRRSIGPTLMYSVE